MVLTDDEGLYEKIQLFHSHGIIWEDSMMTRDEGRLLNE